LYTLPTNEQYSDAQQKAMSEAIAKEGERQAETMSKASGLVVETPTAELPFKAVISQDGQTIEEQYFSSREAAEVFIVNTLKGFDDLPSEEEDLN
jgi:hypothetical protein